MRWAERQNSVTRCGSSRDDRNSTTRRKIVPFEAMNTIHFTKAEGAQNDFVIVDDRQAALSHDERVRFTRAISHRRKGAGSDGVIFIDAARDVDFRMSFYNPDGSVGSMCGNGGRCAALYAFTNGIAGELMRFDVLDGVYSARVEGSMVTLSFPAPRSVGDKEIVHGELGAMSCVFIDTGAPHVVLFHDELPEQFRVPYHELDMRHIGKSLRWHERFAPRGTNVSVLGQVAGEWAIRTFEKGVEDETEACGTGTVAAAIALHLHRDLPTPIALRTHGGDCLIVDFNARTEYAPTDPERVSANLSLQGPAVLVYEGCYAMGEL